MKVWMPSRILDRHVGGNTTYARSIRDGLLSHDVETLAIPSLSSASANAIAETHFAINPIYRSRLGYSPEDVVHWVADTGALLPTSVNSVVTVHGVASHHASGIRNPRAEFIWRSRVKRAIHTSDRVITVSNSSARDISEVFDYDIENISVIHHGIDKRFFNSDFDSLVENAKNPDVLNLLDQDYVLYLGNIEPRKNIGSLIDAFRNNPELRNLKLIIAGKPAWDFVDVMQKIDQTPNVVHLGFVSDNERLILMRNTNLFVFPSLYEGFGFPVLEALAVGAPVLCSDKGALAEVLGPSITLENLDSDTIGAAIVNSLEKSGELIEKFRKAGPEWARQFNWETSVAKHLEIYREISR